MILKKGASYHVKGWNNAAVFLYDGQTNGIAHLVTPKTGRRTKAPVDKLYYTRKSRRKLKPQESTNADQ